MEDVRITQFTKWRFLYIGKGYFGFKDLPLYSMFLGIYGISCIAKYSKNYTFYCMFFVKTNEKLKCLRLVPGSFCVRCEWKIMNS